MKQYLYGKQPVLTRIKQNKEINHLFVLDTPSHQEFLSLAKKNHITYTLSTNKELDKLINGNHQGVIAEVMSYESVSLNDVLQNIPEDKKGLLIMLDGVSDPHNLGAIMRTADAVGADGIIIKKHGSVKLTSTVAKVAAGAIETMPVAMVTNLTKTIDDLKKMDYWIVGTDMKNATYYREVDYTSNIVVVVGSEGDGISQLVKKQCDFMVNIPMHNVVSSLNVSVATAVILYEILHQRRG